MKRAIVSIAAIAISVCAAAVAQDDRARTISVSGDADVRVPPDEVLITLGVETSNMDLTLAKQENDRLSQAVIQAAKRHGVEDKHVQTGHLGIEPRYTSDYTRREFLGYFVQKTIAVTLRDIPSFEALLSDALESGANYVHGIDFRTTELRKHRDEARALALTAAKEKAEAMAAILGERVGRPLSIDEGYSHWYSGYGGWWGARHGGAMSQNVVQNTGGGAPDGPTAPGQISVTASVRVTFELAD